MSSRAKRRDIAIVGVGVRLPGADSLDEFWGHLAAGRSLITEVPARRWDKTALRGDPAKGNKTASIWGGFVADADCFDAAFFNVSPREAAWMDPQQRFALELAWQAIEDAGYRAGSLAGSRTGVFMGVCHWDYAELLEKHLAQIDAYMPTGIAFSIIANRVSHFFDFRGPSITNDTACAASLTSVHEAVQALRAGSCDLALAGGVNLIWSPNHFVAFSKNGMLSRDGASKAFDERADGYVRGEGGAMLLLKPLQQALADGDAIHAVIRGSGVNHGGHTNSLTVTSPQAQADLVAGVIEAAGVPPDSIGYIEAHGTGTPLGDPIEITGLKQAFARLYAAAGREPVAESCGIGSVKTNIGHLEGAAGVAGIVKVLAALAHDALPANVDFGAVNSLIRLDGTPFRIQRELSAWPRRPDQPRRAGVSAFGFGGSNAHVLIEEAPAGPVAAPVAGPQWIPLSARDEGRLAAMARRLLAWLEGPGAGVDLADLAWTLQQGREAMAARALWRVDDLPALQAALADFIRAGADSAVLHRPTADAPQDEDAAAARWLAGEGVAWSAPQTPQTPRRRLHLPTYPFARERHWMDAALGAKDPEPVVHPLLHRNLSRLGEQRYRTPLAGSEFFWADHHVGTTQVLPGVVCLEMARAAWAQAVGRTGEGAVACDIGQLVWARPVLAGESPARLEIRLGPARRPASADFSGTADDLHFAIEQLDGDGHGGSPNAQGSIVAAAAEEAEILDLAALRAQASGPSLTPAQLYERLAATGMHHGPAFRAVAGLHAGDGYLLVSLKLPRLLRATLDSFALHPVMLDAAIQAWIGLESTEGTMAGAAVPFSCGRVAVRGACSDAMWALLKPVGRQEGGLRRFDIALADRDGRVRLRFHDLALRVMAAEEAPAPLFSVPRWEPAPLAGEAETAVQIRVLLAGFDAAAAEALRAASGLPVELLPEPADAGDCALAWFEALRERIAAERGRREQVQWLALLPAESHELAGGALAALFRCLAAEQPRLAGAVVRVAAELAPDRLAAILQAEAARRDGHSEIRYDAAGQRSVLRPAEVELPAVPRTPFPASGVVLVTGGAGGLGRHFRAWLAAHGVTRIVVAGRAAEPAEAISHDADGPQIFYRSCDVADPAQVRALVDWIGAEVGPLKGIIHGAGMLRDGYLITKPAGEAAAVFAPKVRGALNLDAATRHLPLDFFLLCSSIAATLGNPGQADYAAANAFMDAFAAARSRQVAAGERHGLTVAVAWPLWADGGMSVDGPSLKALQRRFGSVPLPTEVALAALDAILADGQHPCVTLHYGAAGRIRQVLADFGAAPEITPMPAAAATGTPGGAAPARLVQAPADGDLLDRTVDWLKDLLGELIQMEPAKIRTQARLEEYGIDSIVIVEMTARMEEALGPLPKTLFFEYVDLAGVAGYLVAEKAAPLAALFAAGTAPEAAPVADEVSSSAPQPASGTAAEADGAAGTHDIAIVGLSLHVAGADDQESFWRMLEQGQHAFRRVPGERWNHEALVHPERDVLGKTVVQTGAFLDGIDRFDPRYFRISQAEAELMSPEVRLFLQTCVEAFEDAGYSRETLQRKYGGNVAVIVGTMTNDYNLYGFQNMLQRGALASGSYTGTVPNMVSYYYGFTGPSYFLDTMCSAAATCVHEAVHMLRSGRAPMVLAGGLSLLLHPQKLIATSQEHFTSKTAEVIRGYGQGADGTILGEGVGALVLKRLADAERDGDHIYGVIKGTGISNAGVRNGFTVPNPRQQAAAIEQALADSGLPPETIGYIEGHGSGTALGDPIEVKALTEAYGRHMTARQGCPIGTVKSNVAHLLGAAALPGIVKVLLQMQRGKLAPSLHAETLNPNIPFSDTPFYVQRELADWTPRRDAAGRVLPRRAGVTSIGAGGINVHIILEEHVPAAPAQEETGPALCVFSAMTPERLRILLERFDTWLAVHPDAPLAPLADLAWTLQTGRNELPCRFAVVVQDVAQLRQALARFRADGEAGEGAVYTPTILDRDPRVDAGKLQAALAGRQLVELARWWADGVVIPWEKQPGAERRRRLSLPSYPFESVRCWYASYPDAPSVVTPMGAGLKLHPFVGRNLSDRHGLRYATDIHLGELLDYVFTWKRQQQLLPVVVAEMAAAVAREAGFGTELALHGLEAARAPDWTRAPVLTATVLEEGGAPLIELSASEGEGAATPTGKGASTPFARARIGDLLPAMPQVELAVLTGGPQQAAAEIYRQLAESQLGFRPYLEVIEALWPQAGGGALCRLRANPPQQDHFKRDVFLSAPALGAAWQTMALLQPETARHAVARIDSLRFGGGEVRYLLLRPAAGDPAAWDLLALTEAGATAAALLGLRLAPPEQLAWSPPPDRAEPVRSLAAAMPAARLDGGVPAVAAQAIAATTAVTADPAPAAPQDGARAAFSLGLRELAGELLKFPPADINPRSPFYDLGFDSISLTRLANEINARYGSSLTPAIFYECEHIDDLAGWLAIRHPEALVDVQSVPNAPPVPASAPAMPAAPAAAGPVAVVGMALRLPGSPDAESFFAHLLAGDDLVGPLPLERYSPAYRARMEAGGFPLQGGFLADIDRFDAAFFKATPHEACRMDPQQRLLLETAQQAVESAGYRPEELPGATGVFVGVSGRDYASLLQAEGVPSDAYVATGNSLAMVANRVSWQFNLHGPSEAVDTACSSSLVALMGAVDAIRQGRCAMALAAGVNLALAIEGFEGPWQAGMLSPTARCRSFAAEADGYVRGEGVVVLVLKDLAAAERDGDAILGLVAGGAVNHGGHAGSLTAPNARSQADLVAAAMAGVDPRSIGYIETHGTGTPLGDPVEINGLRLAYDRLAGEGEERGGLRIGLGSVKSNLGHLEAAAGLAGVAKVLLAMAARELPPTLHCANVNPYIELAGSPFHLVRSRQPWPATADAQGRLLPRRAGVSSFGFGGSNAHVILEAYEGRAVRRRPVLPHRTFADTRYWVPVGNVGSVNAEGAQSSAPVLLAPAWLDVPLAASAALLPRRLILPCEFDLGAGVPDTIPVPPLAGDAGQRYGTLAEALLLALQQALRQGIDDNLLVQLLVPGDSTRGIHAGLGALLDSTCAEVPRLLGQVVEVPADMPAAEALAVLEREARQGGHRRVRYRDGRRCVRTWQDLPAAAGPAFSWRPGGVYLISGGLGALGRHVARDILARAPGAHLVLLGQSPLDEARRAQLAELTAAASGGATVRHEQLDIGDPGRQPAVAALVRDCIAQYGALHGVIHCAGIHRDSALIRKTPEQLRAVLAPKLRGALSLLEACRGLRLDGFVLFSSLAGAVGNAGQADYAAANGFLAALAEAQGAPLVAIDWPLWREGGMRVAPAGEQAFFERMGQRPLATRDGLAALRRCLAAGQREVAVVAGEGARIRAFFREAALLPRPGIQSQPATGLPARRAVAERLTGLLADISGLAAGAIEADAPLENYGIDSLMINRLNQALGERFGRLSKTLFFECRTLAQVADHLLAKHPEACLAWAGPGAATTATAAPTAVPLAAPISAAAATEPIAVIGMSGRYPGAADLDEFWANLAAGRECVGEIPADRWAVEGFYEADPDRAVAGGRSYARRGGFIDGFADFDPLFFRISPREAAAMDPQERLFLMEAWAACEDAGYPRARLARQYGGRVGVFAGVTKTGYAHYAPWQSESGSRVRPVTSFASIANRVSFCLGLSGPSLPIDTMCSSSLTAVHEACEHLRRGECEVALAGGVNLYLHPDNYIELSAARMLSPDGHCRSFGAGGKGFVPGEGVGCLVLKPLSRALADGDRVHGVILASAINHGGNTAGYTVPNPHAQAAVVREALARAGVAGADIGYIEAHGTGTELGDPIEFTGLCQAFGDGGRDDLPPGACALGSVKSSIGHLEAAAGIAGLTKVLLQMRHRQLAPTLHAEPANPNLDLAASPFRLQTRLAPWEPPSRQRRLLAGVSSFGAGGANAHVVVAAPEPEVLPATDDAPGVQAVVLSARNPERLREYAERLLAFLTADAAQPAVAAAGQPPAVETLRRLLADILSVEPGDIDPAEPFDSYGVEPVHRHALRRGLEQTLAVSLASAEVEGWNSLNEAAAALAEVMPAVPAADGGTTAPVDLADLAWTLQIGREAMEQRLAILASSREELTASLRTWLDAPAGQEPANVLRGSVEGRKGALGLLADEPDMQGLLGRWLSQGDLRRVLGLWVNGLEVDWRLLPRPRPPHIVSAPTYPFARQRFWLPARPDDLRGALADALAKTQPGREALLAEQAELEGQLACLIGAVAAEWPPVPESGYWPAWRAALDGLQKSASHGDFLRSPAGRCSPASAAEAWAAWDAYRARVAAGGGPLAQVDLVGTVVRALPDILAGRRPATEVMFPAGRMDLVEPVYKQNAVAGRFNAALAAAAAALVGGRAAGGAPALRILEIGAGTGGTTGPVLQALAPWSAAIAEYRYTDVSRAFLIHAERTFRAQAPWLQTALFDVEQPVAGQALLPGRYDLVIAANVLHATRRMDATLATVRDLLAPGGLLLVNETSRATLFTHLTFGLLEGWWRFADPERRIPGTPSLSAASWRQLAEETGLVWLGVSSEAEMALGQQVWAAARSGDAVPLPAPQMPVGAPVPAPVPSRPSGAVASAGGLQGLIVEALAATLNLAPAAIDPALSFADYGLDSILGAEFVHRLRQHPGVRLAQTDLFDYPSVIQLTGFLAGQGIVVPSVPAAPAAVACARPAGDEAASRIAAAVRPAAPAGERELGGREPIAIVGYSGRFAGSPDPEALWRHLRDGDDLVRPVTRFDLAPFYRDAAPGSWCNRGSFIDAVDRFDARFFNISGLEATYMDPQQRLFLEEAWRTLEHAGHAGADMEGRRCGVFVGAAHGDYQELFRRQPPGQAFWGNTCSLIPARIAYYLNLKGPAVAVDTACSSSLVALHLACHSLWAGESELALAGGVFVQASPRFYRYANQANMLSPSGRCAAFGANADGIVPGEAVAAVLLRPLSQALADGDTIHGLIVASGINQDGATNGITAPSALSQEQLIREVYGRYGIDPARIGLVEAHGTGTPLGDPIEHAALTRAYRGWTDATGYCALGSIKSNLGHATTAAGIAGVLKVLLALKHGQIPPTLHAAPSNPALSLVDSPFYLNDRPVDWPARPGQPRLAAVSSFGFGGTNAHAVIEEGPAASSFFASGLARPAWLFVLSARSAAQLQAQVRRLAEHLDTEPEQAAGDIAYTLAVGRRHGPHRLALVASDRSALAEGLAAWLAGRPGPAVAGSVGEAPPPLLPTMPAMPDAATADGSVWRQALDALAQAYLGGQDAAPALQFGAERGRRVALPTTVFEGKSFWIGETAATAPETPVVEAPAAQTSLPAAPAPRAAASLPLRLAPPSACVLGPAEPRDPAPAPVRLVPLTATAISAEPSTPRLRRRPDAAGVRHLELLGPLDGRLADELAVELAAVAADASVHAVCLTGDGQGGAAIPDFSSPLACPVPVVAALEAGGAAALALAAHCDFLVLAEGGRYGLTAKLPAQALALLQRRFGADGLRRLQADEGAVIGSALAAGGLVVPAGTTEARALELARQIAAAPRLALLELKRHMRGGTQAPDDLPPPALGSDLLAAGPAGAAEQAAWGPGRRLELASPVMALELFADGVALLSMREREHKNTFTPAFMAGMEEAFARLANEPDCKVLVLTGHDAYFACGGTREGLESLQRGDTRFTDQRIYTLPLDFPLPVIAAMQGHAIGAGWSLGLFCDLALFAAESVYHSNYLGFGFTPGAGATLAFPRRLGDDLGREVLFSAREYKGRELAARGMPLPVFPAAEVLPRALAVAHRLATDSRAALQAAKAQRAAPLRERIEDVLARELAMHETTFIGNPLVKARIASHFAQEPAPSAVLPAPTFAESRGSLRKSLVDSLAEELMMDAGEIRDADGFLALGLDSILAVTWIRKLNAQLGIELPATCIYAHPSVGALLDEVARLRPVAPVADTTPPPVAVLPTPSFAESRGSLRKNLVDSLAEELMMDAGEIRDADGFLALGLDSILAVTWVRKLNAQLGIELPATCIYAHPSVGALLDEVARLLPAAPVEPMPPPVAPPVAPPTPAMQEVTRRISAGAGPADAIAIVGAAGRFPKAADLEVFWANLRAGVDGIVEVPPSRWDIAAYFDPDPQAPGKSYSKWLGAIDDIDLFDAAFFNITAREAELMDPQQRLFLQQAWHALEDAAIDPSSLAGRRCGVFVGSGDSGYGDLVGETNAYSLIGKASSILAARIAYLLDLRGPAIAMDTACSTSLVAIAAACDSLVLGTSDLALAGGACVLLGPQMYVDTCKVGMLSPDGHCHSFDQRANGFVPGEGVGVVLLKRLADAERDGDPIRAVIRGWGVNQDGRTNGITAPNPVAQGELLREVYNRFAIAPASIGLVEAHGTGTPLGDPIEIEGLRAGFGAVPPGTTVALGSVKSNIGHLLASAGVAGALKAMLAVEHAELPPSIHFERQNEHLALAGSPFRIQTRLEPWTAPAGGRRRAAVSAFGFSGTNAHLVLEEYPARPAAPAAGGELLCVLSARSRNQLAAQAAVLAAHVDAHPALDLADVCWTLQSGRQAFECRATFVFATRDELLARLRALAAGETPRGAHLGGDGSGEAATWFAGDADARALLDKWLAAGELERVAKLWVQGAALDWSRLPGAAARRRLHLPGYAFARDRHWVKLAASAPTPALAAPALFAQGAAGDRRFVAALRGDEAWLSREADGASFRVPGLFLAELARAAGELAAGRPVGLGRLVWGPPLDTAELPTELVLRFEEDGNGWRYRIARADAAGDVLLVGELLPAADAAAWPASPVLSADAADGLAALRHARPGARGIASLRCGADAWRAGWNCPPGDPQPACALFDAIGQLAAGRDDAAGLVGPRFPLALAALRSRGPVPREGWIWLWSGAAGLTALVTDSTDRPCLWLEGLSSAGLDAMAPLTSLHIDPEETS